MSERVIWKYPVQPGQFEVDGVLRHVGTFQMSDGLVFHLFEMLA